MAMRLSDENLPEYLAGRGLLPQPADARVEPAGDGNINYVRRVRVTGGPAAGTSWIVKQAREVLERFPEYRVTTERIVFERRYVACVAEHAPECALVLPGILAFDADSRVLVMEDLGSERLSDALDAGHVPDDALDALGAYLGGVHAATREAASRLAAQFANDEMRRLHGEHIFALPYEPDAFPLEPAVRKAADRRLARPGVREAISELRARYYAEASALVHGDPQPGNVMLQRGKPRLIDAEIAHVGDPAFDLGTALAHLLICAAGGPMEDSSRWSRGAERLVEGYRRSGGRAEDVALARRYAGVEILRRTIGAARLPRVAGPAAAEAALEIGVELLLG
jgi:5-methylthioribose kinase